MEVGRSGKKERLVDEKDEWERTGLASRLYVWMGVP